MEKQVGGPTSVTTEIADVHAAMGCSVFLGCGSTYQEIAMMSRPAPSGCREWDPNCQVRLLNSPEREAMQSVVERLQASSDATCRAMGNLGAGLLAHNQVGIYDSPLTVNENGDRTLGDTHPPFGQASLIHIAAQRLDPDTGVPYAESLSNIAKVFAHELVHAFGFGAHDAAFAAMRSRCS
jgi:hypothetical protein